MKKTKGITAILATILFLSFISSDVPRVEAGNGFIPTPVQTGQIPDEANNTPNAANYGTSTEFQFNSPTNQTTLQFYSGVESHVASNNAYAVTSLHVTVNATDPMGGQVSSQYFNHLEVRNSPQPSTNTQYDVLKFVYIALLNAVPYGIGADIQYATATSSSTVGVSGNSVYGDWAFPSGQWPKDSGIEFNFNLEFGQGSVGTYFMHVYYHVEVTECMPDPVSGICDINFTVTRDTKDTIFVCHNRCSSDFSISAAPTSLSVSGGPSGSTATIALGSLNSFSGPISLSANPSEPSLLVSFSPQTLTVPSGGSVQSTLTVTSPVATCVPGSSNLAVTAGQYGIDHSINIPVTVTCPPAFSVSTQSSVTICQGGAWNPPINVTSVNGFVGWVSPSFANPSSFRVSSLYSSWYVAPGQPSSTKYNIWAQDANGNLTPFGSYTFTVTVTAGSVSVSQQVSMTVIYCYPGGSGGSVPAGSAITMADGTGRPVQLVGIGDRVIVYDVTSGYQTAATVTGITIHVTNSLLTLHTTAGLPFRADANPHMRLHVLVNGGMVLVPITQIGPGDRIFNYDLNDWVTVTDVSVAYGGQHVLYDLTTNPSFTSTGAVLEYIANGYPDCPGICKN